MSGGGPGTKFQELPWKRPCGPNGGEHPQERKHNICETTQSPSCLELQSLPKCGAGCIHKKKNNPPQTKNEIFGGFMKYLATCFQCMPMPCIPEVDLAMRPRFCWITARIPKIGQVERRAADKDGILTRSIAKAATLPCTGVNAPTTHHPPSKQKLGAAKTAKSFMSMLPSFRSCCS